jgi:chromosome segregation ATPase
LEENLSAMKHQAEEKMAVILQDLQLRNHLLEDLEEKISTLDSHNQHISLQNHELQTQKNELLALIQIANEELEQIRLNYNNELSNRQNLEDKFNELSKKFTAQNENLEIQNMQLKEKEDKIQNLLESKSLLKKSLADIHDKKIQEMQVNLNAASHLQDELRIAIASYHEEQHKNKLLQQQLSATEEELQAKLKIANQMDHLQDEYASLQKFIKELEANHQELQAENAKFAEREEEFYTLQKEYNDSKMHIADLISQLDNLSILVKDKEMAQIQAEQKTLEAINQNHELTAELERLINEMKQRQI